jgi:hypothetical protein
MISRKYSLDILQTAALNVRVGRVRATVDSSRKDATGLEFLGAMSKVHGVQSCKFLILSQFAPLSGGISTRMGSDVASCKGSDDGIEDSG